MPGTDGLAATRRITGDERLGGVNVVILTTFDLDEYVFEAIRAGPTASWSRTPSRPSSCGPCVPWSTATPCCRRGVTRRLIEEFAARAKEPTADGRRSGC